MGFFEKYPAFSRSERRGLVVLIVLMTVMVLYIFFSKSFIPDGSFTQADYDDLKSQFSSPPVNDTAIVSIEKNTEVSLKLAPFDPNDLDEKGWQKLGLSEKQASSVINYRNKLGWFTSPEQVHQAYAISDELFARIESYLIFNNDSASGQNESFDTESNQIFEINTATQEQLESVRGIGASTAKGIIIVREKLGGYRNLEQLTLVYSISSERYNHIIPQLRVDSSKVVPIDVNNCKPGKLYGHPYIKDWDVVNQIKNEQKNFGNYLDFDDFKSRLNFSDEFFEEIKPYLTF